MNSSSSTGIPESDGPRHPTSAEKFDLLKSVLREMFQLDRGDLDFGIYRIMNMKADEIETFLDNDLLPQVRTALAGVSDEGRFALEVEIEKATEKAIELEIDPDTSPSVFRLKHQLAEAKADTEAESDVYGHLADFFARYYREGDFMSLRRYSSGGREAYLIPYNGEEVKLHWANSDQYYIKTAENYCTYAFTEGDRRVRFEVVVADDEKDNIKSAADKQRRFVLTKGNSAIAHDGDELVVRFEHRPLTEDEKKLFGKGAWQQDRINATSGEQILQSLGLEWQRVLAVSAPTENDPERTLLAKHIGHYTAKNSFDYFIHKDLGSFLRRELDLYLKSEVLNLDDLSLGDAGRLRRALARMQAVRLIADKIIAFLEQLENFQKRLWLKKKFVLETQWCVTLDRIPDMLYPEIVANKAQCEEWLRLYAIDEIVGDLLNGNTGYSVPLTIDFLKSNPSLVLDTCHFHSDFKERLLAALSDAGSLDKQTDGLLMHAENFQALNLIQNRYASQINYVYIDPPFNTKDGDFIYKDEYRSSSWLSAMSDRISLSRYLLLPNGLLVSHIDENECENLQRLLEILFGSENYLGAMVWNKRNPKGDAKGLSIQHENILWAIRNINSLSSLKNNLQRPKKNANLIIDAANKFVKKSKTLNEARKQYSKWIKNKQNKFSKGELAYKFLDDDGRVFRKVSMAWPNRKKAPDQYFVPLIHPKTGKPCPVPMRGWRNKPSSMKELLEKNLIAFGPDESTQPNRIYYLEENMRENISSVFEFGGSSDYEAKALGIVFETMKPLSIAKFICNDKNRGIILDYFAGSGTTGHAVIDLNRQDNGKRKYILVEMGNHFDTVLLPRIKKVVYAQNWKNGKPTSRDEGVSSVIKYVRLESYDDTLDGLILTPPKDNLLAMNNPAMVEDYRLRYALEFETAGSPCLLGEAFDDPFTYTLRVVQDGAHHERSVDLPETFNYLLGLRVDSRKFLDGVLAIAGKDIQGQSCLILWRNLKAMDECALECWFKQHRAQLPNSLDLVFVNGDHTLNALRRQNESWTAKTIEPIFRDLMFKVDSL